MTDRRSFLRGASVLMGHAAFGQVMTAFAAAPREASYFTAAEMDTLRSLVDASVETQKTFRAALAALGINRFATLRADAQVTLLKTRAAEDIARPYDQSFFKILKDYTLTGYFLSEIGATKALAYERVPGGFQGDLPLAANQKAWAI